MANPVPTSPPGRRTHPAPSGPCLPYPTPPAGLRLYTVAPSGAAAIGRSWQGKIGTVAVCPLERPGHGARSTEQPSTDMRQLVEELAAAVLDDLHSEMWALFGHSLGALVGFEIIHEVLRRGGPEPRHLIVSGCAAPHTIRPDTPAISTLTEPEIVRHLRSLGGTPEWVLNQPSALRLLLRTFRADAQLRESWTYQKRRLLPIPITAIAARNDTRAPVASMEPWMQQTAWREVTMNTLPGQHLAALQPENEDWLCALLRDAVWPWADLEPLAPRRARTPPTRPGRSR